MGDKNDSSGMTFSKIFKRGILERIFACEEGDVALPVAFAKQEAMRIIATNLSIRKIKQFCISSCQDLWRTGVLKTTG